MAVTQTLLQEALQMEHLALHQGQLEQFCRYAELLCEWNKKMNLTAITDDVEIAYKHFADSLAPLALLGSFEGKSLIDVGTGAGFPGIPMKIACPGMSLTMIDSLNKRTTFLKEVCRQLKLQAEVYHLRAEEAGKQDGLRESFDFATARAVAHLRELSEYCLPFVKVGGCFLAMKAGEIEQELEEARNSIGMMGGKVERVMSYEIELTGKRTLLVIKKISQTPTKYPRNPAKIAKKPLK